MSGWPPLPYFFSLYGSAAAQSPFLFTLHPPFPLHCHLPEAVTGKFLPPLSMTSFRFSSRQHLTAPHRRPSSSSSRGLPKVVVLFPPPPTQSPSTDLSSSFCSPCSHKGPFAALPVQEKSTCPLWLDALWLCSEAWDVGILGEMLRRYR